jgi:sulfur carrier protein
MIGIRLNGRSVELSGEATVAAAVQQATRRPAAFAQGVAVAVNGEVVPRSGWTATRLADGDEIEVLMAVQGG